METYKCKNHVDILIFDFHRLSSILQNIWSKLKPTIFSESVLSVLLLNRTSASPRCWPTGRDLDANGTGWNSNLKILAAKGSNSVEKLPATWFQGKIANCPVVDSVDFWEMLVNWKPRPSLFWSLAKDYMTSRFVLARWSVRCSECFFPSHFSGEKQIEIECIHSAPSPFIRQLDQELRMEYDVNDQPFSEVSPSVSNLPLSLSFSIWFWCSALQEVMKMLAPKRLQSSPRSSWNSRSEQTFATFASFQSTLQARETNGRWCRIHLRWAGMWGCGWCPLLWKAGEWQFPGWVLDS